MTLGNELSIVQLVWNASLVVQLVMLVLLFASVASWTMIFSRMKLFKQANQKAEQFEQSFWSGGNLNELYQDIQAKKQDCSGMEQIFMTGFEELSRASQYGLDKMTIVSRMMRVALAREINELEQYLTFLATVGSTSPYIGLFGTVWGIMNAFLALGHVEHATLALVAPGIAEALVATAIGLFAAIPAVIAYNRFSSDVDKLENRYEVFLEECLTIFQRSTAKVK